MGLRAGRLNKRVTIQEATVTQNAAGEEIPSWATFVEVWGNPQALTGSERFGAQQVNPKVSHNLEVRRRSGLHTEMRALYTDTLGTHVLEFDAILPNEAGDGFDILCTENPDATA